MVDVAPNLSEALLQLQIRGFSKLLEIKDFGNFGTQLVPIFNIRQIADCMKIEETREPESRFNEIRFSGLE